MHQISGHKCLYRCKTKIIKCLPDLGNLCCVFHGRATFGHPSLQVPKSFLQSCCNIHALASLKRIEAPSVVAPKHKRQKMEQLCQFPALKNNATNIIHLVTSGHGLPTHSQQYWNVQLHGPQQAPGLYVYQKVSISKDFCPKTSKRVPLAEKLISFQMDPISSMVFLLARFGGALPTLSLAATKQLAALAAELSHKLGQSGASLAYRDFSHAVAVDGRNKGIRLLSHKIPFTIPGVHYPLDFPSPSDVSWGRDFSAIRRKKHRSQDVDSLELN